MSEATILHEANSWAIAGVRSAEKFFLAISELVPEATHIFLEGPPDSDVAALLSVHAASGEYHARSGTLCSWPAETSASHFVPRPRFFTPWQRPRVGMPNPRSVTTYTSIEMITRWSSGSMRSLILS